MITLNTLIYTAVLSFAGSFLLVLRKAFYARTMPETELRRELSETVSVFRDIKTRLVIPPFVFIHDAFSPKIYKEFEIIISKFRINVLRMERHLLRLANYIRGKREMKMNNDGHPYWNQLTDSKKEEEEEKEDPTNL